MMKNGQDKVALIRVRFVSEAKIGEEEYTVETEASETEGPFIHTRITRQGMPVSLRKVEHRWDADAGGRGMMIQELMLRQHQAAVRGLGSGGGAEEKSPADYLEDLKSLLKKKNHPEALTLLEDALSFYPDDPFLLSYQGCLEAIVNKRYVRGINTCKSALESLEHKIPFGHDFFYPLFYLNLGRAYLAAGRKKEAVEAFRKGRTYDHNNEDILWEFKKLGIRKRPAIPLLERSNPLNKYIGVILHRLGK